MEARRGPRKSTIIAAFSVLLIFPLIVWSFFLPWYVVSAPESPNRPGSLDLFYLDRVEQFRLTNGTVSSHHWMSYDVPQASPIQAMFWGLIAVSVFFAIGAALLMISMAWQIVRGRLGLIARVASFLLPFAGWTVVLYFWLAFPVAMQATGEWPSGFFASEYIDWADVVLTYGPGTGWFVSLANASLALIASYGAHRAFPSTKASLGTKAPAE